MSQSAPARHDEVQRAARKLALDDGCINTGMTDSAAEYGDIKQRIQQKLEAIHGVS